MSHHEPTTAVVPVTALDIARAGTTTHGTFGPLDITADQLQRRMEKLATAAPATRLQARPRLDSTRWEHDPTLLREAVLAAPAGTAWTPASLTAHREHERSAAPPIAAVLHDQHMLVEFDHGLGDQNFLVNLSSALTSPAGAPLPEWFSTASVRAPLARAIARTFGTSPQRSLEFLARRRDQNSIPAEAPATPSRPGEGSPVPWAPSYAVAYSRGTKQAWDEVEAWRRSFASPPSMAAINMAVLTLALQEAGIEVSPTYHMLFDARRYLRPTDHVTQNFASGVDLRIPGTLTPQRLHRAIMSAVTTGAPLTSLAATKLMVARRLRRGEPIPHPLDHTDRPARPIARLAFTDGGRPPQIAAMPWAAGPDERHCIVACTPGGPEWITLATSRVDKRFHFTASYYDNVFPRERVEAAVIAATTDPVALLDRHAAITQEEA